MRAESTNLNKHSRREEVYFSYTILLGNKAAKNPPAMQEMWVQSPGEGNGNPLQYFCLKNPADVGNLISGSSAFSKSSLNIWKFTVHVLLKPGLENFEHYFTSV